MLNLVHVRSFVAIVDEGGFGEAARRLGCAQPTVSQHIRKLEGALQTALLYRDRQTCGPTREGLAFLPYARSLLAVADRAGAAVRGQALLIGASSNVGIYLLQPQLTAFRADGKGGKGKGGKDAGGGGGTEVGLWIGKNPDVAERLERHEVDVAVMEWWDGRPGFTAEIWRSEPLVVIVPPGHPWAAATAVTKAELLETPLIGGESGTGTGRLLREALGKEADDMRVGLELGSTEAVKHAVKAGLGVSLVLAGAVVDEVRAGSLRSIPLADATLAKNIFVVRHRDQPREAAASRFVNHLLQEAGGA